jgi:hypothetical protein
MFWIGLIVLASTANTGLNSNGESGHPLVFSCSFLKIEF